VGDDALADAICPVRCRHAVAGAGAAWLSPTPCSAGGAAATAVRRASNFWFAAGGAFVARRADCTTCEHDFPFRDGAGVLVDVGYRVNDRMDVAAELFWTPTESESGRDRANLTHLDAIAQFRPWASSGFFLKGGAGMAFVPTGPSDRRAPSARAFGESAAVTFRPADRFGSRYSPRSLRARRPGDLERHLRTCSPAGRWV
jgi:hypothetical protein